MGDSPYVTPLLYKLHFKCRLLPIKHKASLLEGLSVSHSIGQDSLRWQVWCFHQLNTAIHRTLKVHLLFSSTRPLKWSSPPSKFEWTTTLLVFQRLLKKWVFLSAFGIDDWGPSCFSLFSSGFVYDLCSHVLCWFCVFVLFLILKCF